MGGLLEAQFHGEAKFAIASFESAASFRDALFGSKEKPQHAYFIAIKADRAFDLIGAKFSKVPAFNQADFKQAPDLDNVRFPARPFWRGGDKDLVPQYRALKRLAFRATTMSASRWPSKASCAHAAGLSISGMVRACGSAWAMTSLPIAGARFGGRS